MIEVTFKIRTVEDIPRAVRELELAFHNGTKVGLLAAMKVAKEKAIQLASKRIAERHGNVRDKSDSTRPYVDSFKVSKPEGQRNQGWKATLTNTAPDAGIQEFGRGKNKRQAPPKVIEKYLEAQNLIPKQRNTSFPKRGKALARLKPRKPGVALKPAKAKVSRALRSKTPTRGVLLSGRGLSRKQIIWLAARSHAKKGQPALHILRDTFRFLQDTKAGREAIEQAINAQIRRTGTKLSR